MNKLLEYRYPLISNTNKEKTSERTQTIYPREMCHLGNRGNWIPSCFFCSVISPSPNLMAGLLINKNTVREWGVLEGGN